MKFRKKPVVIEAVQFTPEFHDELLAHLEGCRWHMSGNGICITTLEGEHLASPGDWIIKGVNGEFYPCKPDIFAKTYGVAEGGEDRLGALEHMVELRDRLIDRMRESAERWDALIGSPRVHIVGGARFDEDGWLLCAEFYSDEYWNGAAKAQAVETLTRYADFRRKDMEKFSYSPPAERPTYGESVRRALGREC